MDSGGAADIFLRPPLMGWGLGLKRLEINFLEEKNGI
jgi:hypothetical protein